MTISAEYPFSPRRVEVLGSRMSFIDEGEGEGDPIVFLHGNPTWSYVWRNVIPHVKGLGRCIAPDLIGMGRSDKPDIPYRFADHARYLAAFLDGLSLDRITFVIHDWGSALGFDWAMRHLERVRGLAFMEGLITPVPSWSQFHPEMREVFQAFRTPGVGEKMILDDNMFIVLVLPGGTKRKLGDAEMAHYRAPFIDPATRHPMLAWPRQIPIEGQPADVVGIVNTYRDALVRSTLPKLMFAATPGALVQPPVVEWCKANLPNLEVDDVGEGIHYLQEDHPHEIGVALAAWIKKTRSARAHS